VEGRKEGKGSMGNRVGERVGGERGLLPLRLLSLEEEEEEKEKEEEKEVYFEQVVHAVQSSMGTVPSVGGAMRSISSLSARAHKGRRRRRRNKRREEEVKKPRICIFITIIINGMRR